MFCGGEETHPPGLGVSAASVGPPSLESRGRATGAKNSAQTSFHPKQKELFHSVSARCACVLSAHEQGLPFSLHSVVLFVLRHSLHSLWVGMAPLFESIPARGAETYRPLCARAMTPPPLRARALTPPPLCAIRMTARPPPWSRSLGAHLLIDVLTVTLQNDARMTGTQRNRHCDRRATQVSSVNAIPPLRSVGFRFSFCYVASSPLSVCLPLAWAVMS